MRCKLILNPVAGKGRANRLRPKVEELLHALQISFHTVLTDGVMKAAQYAETAAEEGYDTVIAAGGDGTCNEVINGLMKARDAGSAVADLAVLPLGRGNDFSYGLGLSTEIGKDLSYLAEQAPRPLDVGFIQGGYYPDGRYFGNGIGIGFDTIVGLEAARLKHIHGFAAYVIGAAKTFFRFPPPPNVDLRYNGTSIAAVSNQISILNGKRMGGTFYMAPDGLSDDGVLNLCMTQRPLSRREMAGLILQYTKGNQAASPLIHTATSDHFTIKSDQGNLVCHADGETICIEGTELSISLRKAALSVYAPSGNQRI